jgi:hypothetical protein
MAAEFKFPCPACGHSVQGNTRDCGTEITCPACQEDIAVPQLDLAMRLHYSRADHSVPVPQHATAAPRADGVVPPPPPPPPMCKLAVLSFWLSLSSVLIWPLGFVPGILLGRKARTEIEENPKLHGRGLAKAGLIMGYGFAFIFCMAAVLFAVHIFKGSRDADKAGQKTQVVVLTNTPIRQPDTNLPGVSEPVRTNIAWTLNLTNMNLASTAIADWPAAGKIHGVDFKHSVAETKPNVLTLRESPGSPHDLTLTLLFRQKPGENLGSNTFEISPDSEPVLRQVRIGWKDGRGKTKEWQGFTNGYAMKLAFANIIRNRVTGTNTLAGAIFLCLPDTNYSYVAGTFNASFVPPPVRTNVIPSQPTKTQPTQTKKVGKKGKRAR